MPSTYAHYRFGSQLLPTLPADTRRTISRFRRMFDVGLHGPDIFFFYSPVTNFGYNLGHKYHFQNGKDFFTRVCRTTRMEGGEAAQSYLYGLLCHYALDRVIHPFIEMLDLPDPTFHVRLEAEFDRFLLEKDGKTPAHEQDLSPHIQLTPGECETVAKFYPGSTAGAVRSGVRNMALATRAFSYAAGSRRNLVEGGLRLISSTLSGMLIPTQPSPDCRQHDETMLELYDQAIQSYPGLLAQIQANLTYGAALDDAFLPYFG